jgi:type II secretory ATPase GspE/PulE/Tfp pilus assembly ATPase PilB-like protein
VQQAVSTEFIPDEYLKGDIQILIGAIVERVVELNASDLFLMCQQNGYLVAIRRLGTIEALTALPTDRAMSMINTIKATAGMELSEKLRPLDGRWRFSSEKPEGRMNVDFRVNSIGTLYGEDMALRILSTDKSVRMLDELGMEPRQVSQVSSMLNNSGGLILVTGPTGSGKTTTLYACLEHLNDGRRKINTLEDPIEQVIPGLRQSQILPKRDLGFVELLRGVMRQSPDVIMIGEIRDAETAQIAVRAANSGHLVLSTVHAPVSTNALQSMLAYGVNPFFLSSCLQGVIAQRLIRQLNPETRRAYELGHSNQTFADIRHLLKEDQGHLIYGPDPGDLQHGYTGQSGIFEVLEMNKNLRQHIAKGVTARELREVAITDGLLDFRRIGLLRVARGETSIEELSSKIPSEFLGLDG